LTKVNKTVFLLLLMLVSVSCDDDKECNQVPGAENLLPLQVSNYWITETKVDGFSPTKITRRIDMKVTISGVEYFRMPVEIEENPALLRRDTAYYRIGDNGYIYYRSSTSSTEKEFLRPSACDGDKWPYQDGTMRMSIEDYHFEDADTTISNCAHFYYGVADPMADVGGVTVLATGIGYLYEDAPWVSLELTEAHINGVTYLFK
jgi:hypothetical protein